MITPRLIIIMGLMAAGLIGFIIWDYKPLNGTLPEEEREKILDDITGLTPKAQTPKTSSSYRTLFQEPTPERLEQVHQETRLKEIERQAQQLIQQTDQLIKEHQLLLPHASKKTQTQTVQDLQQRIDTLKESIQHNQTTQGEQQP